MPSYDRLPAARSLRPAALALVLAAGACTSDATTLDAEEPLALVTQKKSAGAVELRPNGVYFAEVTASGSGCPAGSWVSSISPDGQVFTTTFSSYEVFVDESVRNSSRDCAIVMNLTSDAARSFAVVSVFYSGYLFLDPGVTGRQTVRYGFHGQSADAGNSRTDFTGPEDREFVIRDDVGVDKQKWSACGAQHTLTASTELRLQGKGSKGVGYVNVSAVDGSAATLELRLGWRACGGNGNSGNSGNNGNNGKGNQK